MYSMCALYDTMYMYMHIVLAKCRVEKQRATDIDRPTETERGRGGKRSGRRGRRKELY